MKKTVYLDTKEKFVKFIALMTIITSFLLTPLVNASYSEISGNSNYATYNGHKVGAITYGIRYDPVCTDETSSVFEVGNSAAIGEDWYDYTYFRHYYVELDSTQITLQAVQVWKDLDGDNIKDAGEPSGSVNYVRYVDPHLANGGDGSELEDLVDLMVDFAELLTGVFIPNPFSLLAGGTVSPCYTTITVTFGSPEYNALRGEVKYYGVVDDYIKIKIKVTTRGDWTVYYEPLDTYVTQKTITKINYIYIIVNEVP